MNAPHDPQRRPGDDGAPDLPETLRHPVPPLQAPPGAFDDIRSRARTRRRARVMWAGVAVAGCVAVGAVAVNVTSDDASSSSTVAVSADETTAQAQPSAEPSDTTPETGATAGTSAPATHDDTKTPKAQGPATCTTSDLDISLGAGEGAAGSQYRPLRITNNGSTPCYLYGFPGVSMVDGAGKQIGKPADRDGAQAGGKVVMKPGQREEVTLRIVNAANFGGQCDLTDAAGVRVYPPGERHSVVVPVKGLAGCASDDVETLTVTSFGVH